MGAATVVRAARQRSGLSLRELAARAETSHATLSAYETGAKTPGVGTLERIVRAAGFALDLELVPRVDGAGQGDRGEELEAVLALAAQFPARHAATLTFPRFPPAPA
jgi:transcriptional regulator with XRE-family HTH domain